MSCSLAALVGAVLSLGGCAGVPDEASFSRPDPSARLKAIQAAAVSDDQESLRELIKCLESDDPAERMLAIRALERRTGQTFGYDHSARRGARDEAVERWVEWYKKEVAGGAGESVADSAGRSRGGSGRATP
ncbi:MAG: HEAT repeat domain-containing protein [Phycisphaerales bacterium]